MTSRKLVSRLALALAAAAPSAFAQQPAAAPAPVTAPAPAAAPPAAAPAPAAAPPAAQSPGVAGVPNLVPPAQDGSPVSRTTEELQRKLETMLRGNGLTSEQVATRAVQSSYQIAAKRRALEAAEADVRQAKSGYVPTLSLSARYTRLSDIPEPDFGFGDGYLVGTTQPGPQTSLDDQVGFSADFTFPVVLDQYSLKATLNVPLSDYLLRTSHAVAASSQQRESSDLDRRATELSVARDARVAYYQWIRAQGASFVAEQALEQSRGHLIDAQNSFQAGLLSRADVLRAESQVKSSELFLQRARSSADIATARIRVLMHEPPERRYEVGENVLAPLPPVPGVASEPAAFAEASSKRLELHQLRANEQALRQQAKVASAGNYPRLDAQGNYEYANPNSRIFPQEDAWHGTWDVSVILSWTPTGIFAAQASESSLAARAAEITAQSEAFRDSLRLEVSQALSDERDAAFAVSVSEQALAAAEEGYRVRRELFRSGRATVVEVTDAETELTRARLELVNAHVDLRIARVQLDHVLGRDVKR